MRQRAPVLLALLLCTALLGGCGKKKAEYEHASESMKPEGYGLEGAGAAGPAEPETFSAGELEPLDGTGDNLMAADTASDEYRAVYGRSTAPLFPVFFDFDSALISVDQEPNLIASGDHLRENPAITVVVEGNCDERGTADYNLALGEVRAQNVKKYLVNLGVDGGRITTISYGEERPLYPGSDEGSWAMNRRADLVIP